MHAQQLCCQSPKLIESLIYLSTSFLFGSETRRKKNMKRYDFGVSSSRQCTIAQTCNDRSNSMLPALSFYLLPAHAFAHGVHATGTLWHRIRQRIHIPGSNKNNTETLRHVILHTWTREPVRQSADVVSILK